LQRLNAKDRMQTKDQLSLHSCEPSSNRASSLKSRFASLVCDLTSPNQGTNLKGGWILSDCLASLSCVWTSSVHAPHLERASAVSSRILCFSRYSDFFWSLNMFGTRLAFVFSRNKLGTGITYVCQGLKNILSLSVMHGLGVIRSQSSGRIEH
jgi:hypothetical protein